MTTGRKPERAGGGKGKNKASAVNRPAAVFRTLKITLIYVAVGLICIFVTGGILDRAFAEYPNAQTVSYIKGLVYIIVTAAVSFPLICKPIRKLYDAGDELAGTNGMLERSTDSYKKLYGESERKQVLTQALINSTPDLIFYKDRDGVYMGCNKAFEAFTGKPEDEITGMTDSRIFSRENADIFTRTDLQTF